MDRQFIVICDQQPADFAEKLGVSLRPGFWVTFLWQLASGNLITVTAWGEGVNMTW